MTDTRVTNPKLWSTDDVIAHLQESGKVSEEFLTLLCEHNVTGHEFLLFDKETLKELGITGIRSVKVLSVIEKLKDLGSALQPLRISPGSTTDVANIAANEEVKNLKYQFLKQLGQGAFGITYLAQDTEQNERVVVKIIQYVSDLDINNVLREGTVMLKFQHDHILKGLDLFFTTTTKSLCIVLEYCEFGDLAKHLKLTGPLHFSVATKWLYQIATAVHYLHAQKLIHRDIKPSNIMLTRARDDGSSNSIDIKLGDFGLSSTMQGTMIKSVVGAIAYMAPEVLQGKYNIKADLWSCGVVALEMATGKTPCGALQSMEQVEAAVKDIPHGISTAYAKIVRALLVPHAPDRLDAAGLAASDLFAKFRPTNVTSKSFVTSCKLIIEEALGLYQKAVVMPEPCVFLKYRPHPDTLHVHVARCNINDTPDAADIVANMFGRSGGHNDQLLSCYRINDMVFIKGTMRAVQLHNKANELATKYGPDKIVAPTFRLPVNGDISWKRRILQHFADNYSSGIVKRYGPHVTIRLAYHVAPSRDVAEKIIAGNFAILAGTDPGFFAQGLYFSLDASYALQYYTPVAADEAVLLVCLVCTGNSLPVTDMSFYGKPLLPKTDSHVTVVAQEDFQKAICYPVPPKSWKRYEKENRLFTEIVVRDESQVLPLLLVSLRPFDASCYHDGIVIGRRLVCTVDPFPETVFPALQTALFQAFVGGQLWRGRSRIASYGAEGIVSIDEARTEIEVRIGTERRDTTSLCGAVELICHSINIIRAVQVQRCPGIHLQEEVLRIPDLRGNICMGKVFGYSEDECRSATAWQVSGRDGKDDNIVELITGLSTTVQSQGTTLNELLNYFTYLIHSTGTCTEHRLSPWLELRELAGKVFSMSQAQSLPFLSTLFAEFSQETFRICRPRLEVRSPSDNLIRGFESWITMKEEWLHNTDPMRWLSGLNDQQREILMWNLKPLFIDTSVINLTNIKLIPCLYCLRHGDDLDTIFSTGFHNLDILGDNPFGRGIYVTPDMEYASKFCRFVRCCEECVLIVCLAAVGMTYPITRKCDYQRPADMNSGSKFETFLQGAMSLKKGFDSHFAQVVEVPTSTPFPGAYEQAPPSAYSSAYKEIALQSPMQVLPIAVLYHTHSIG